MPIVVMGVSGAGKSAVASALAARLGLPFLDADDLHPAANVAKMAAGHPLDDDDRWPWLDALARAGAHQAAASGDVVIACSALRRAYRDRLRTGMPDARFLELDVSRAELERRVANRPGHFMPASLLDSQLATLEPLQSDEPGVRLDADGPLETIVDAAVASLGVQRPGVASAAKGVPMASANIPAVIEKHLAELSAPGVLSVRPGFVLRDGWLTDRAAIVVTVDREVALPTELGGVQVDVRTASAAKRMQLADPTEYVRSVGASPDLGAVPYFADERRIGVGGQLHRVLAPEDVDDLHVVADTAAAPTKPQLAYTGPTGVTLAPITGQATVTLSASPDSGWPTLEAFLTATAHTLTVGLYDFTSAHVLKTVETVLAGRTVKLVLDHPARNPTADQSDEQTVAALHTAFGSELEQAWALERSDPKATAWIFPSAYHIKVAVRDHATVWLSSGNWNNSNQPDIDPVTTPGDAAEARTRDRDWHVVIESPALAAVFEAYLLHDLSIARAHNATTFTALSDSAFVPPLLQTPPFAEFTAAKTISGDLRIDPLLTPDPGSYADAVIALIASATTSLHLQFQYIELPKTPSAATAKFTALVQAVIDRQKAGVEVKVIMSQYETAGYLEQLQTMGLDVVHDVKLQNNVHNKGIVVDGKSVLVSSQNWSSAGTLTNRDAGVILHSAEAAAYFDAIFLHDWEHLAAQKTTVD